MIAYSILALFIGFNLVYLFCLYTRDNSWIDIWWAVGFSLFTFSQVVFYNPNFSFNQLMVYGLVYLWSIRLAIHLLLRKLRRPGEDSRYVKMREGWGERWRIKAYFRVFMLQMAFMLIIALPIYLVAYTVQSVVLVIIGSLIAVYGLIFETIADYQLTQFRKQSNDHSKFIQSGLWYYSRHPNYFGEAVFWWGIALIALPSSVGYIGLISPLIITLLLRFVSGVPLLEKKLQNNPEFITYSKQTPAMIPNFFKKN